MTRKKFAYLCCVLGGVPRGQRGAAQSEVAGHRDSQDTECEQQVVDDIGCTSIPRRDRCRDPEEPLPRGGKPRLGGEPCAEVVVQEGDRGPSDHQARTQQGDAHDSDMAPCARVRLTGVLTSREHQCDDEAQRCGGGDRMREAGLQHHLG